VCAAHSFVLDRRIAASPTVIRENLEIDMAGAVVIFDEAQYASAMRAVRGRLLTAHPLLLGMPLLDNSNIEDVARDAASVDISWAELVGTCAALDCALSLSLSLSLSL